MVTISGYRLIKKVFEDFKLLIYKGRRLSDGKCALVKVLKSKYPTQWELLQFRHEYTITNNLNLTGIVQAESLENYRNGLVLVMEDFGGIPLNSYASNQPLSLNEFLPIAIQISLILDGLYSYQIVHKDIKPQNFFINPKTKQVKLTNFSIATLVPRENPVLQNPKLLEGTLAYMSPEQTGRMNRSLDYRSDFYSVGVTFYELLTGQLPFQSTDPLDLIHCHIARQPTSPAEINPAIAIAVNDIVLKLMAKEPAERYQSILGLKQDLEICLKQWEANGSIDAFPLGERDVCDRFAIAEKLYGRESEVQTLLATFERIAQGNTEVILVSGFSGIGKTALINEIHKPILRQGGYFIKGKFDQLRRDVPLSALVQAFRELLRQLIAENTSQVEAWKNELKQALGENGQVIVDVLPELEFLLGKQPKVPELEASAAQNRFYLMFGKFIRVFTCACHPLVIFLDDLQWADLASLKLIQSILTETNTRYLLFIGAYLDREVSPALMLTVSELRQTQITVNQITLAPLDRSFLNHLIADTLSCSCERAIPLTELVQSKTQGNPFFAIWFLKSLYQDRIIAYDYSCGYWQCDIARVKALSCSDDVVEFMAARLLLLPESTQSVLKLAACIGDRFDLSAVALVSSHSEEETMTHLWRALQEGLVLPVSEIYKFFQDVEATEAAQASSVCVGYKFLHDRVQQAAYSLIPENEKLSTHLKIGQLLLRDTTAEEREEKIFEIVNQLNIGRSLINQQTERDRLAQLNLIAGRKARTATAYAAAFNYFSIGLELLASDCWQKEYDLTLALSVAAAEAAYLSGNFQQQEQLADLVLQQGRSLLDRVKVYELKILASVARGQLLKAVQIALQVLKHLGVSFPKRPTPWKVLLALIKTKLTLSGKSIEDLIHLPEMSQPDKLAAMRIMGIVGSPAYNSAPELMPLLALTGVELSIKYGNASMSAYGYASYGVILCGALGDIDSGYRFGQLALKLQEKFHAKELKARTFFVFNNFIRHWKEHLQAGLKPLLEAYAIALETGDLEFAAYCAYIYCYHSYFAGKELRALDRDLVAYIGAIAQLKQETSLNLLWLYRQVVLNLLGDAFDPCLSIGESFNEQHMLPQFLETNHQAAIFDVYFNQLILCYLFGRYPQAADHAAKAEKYLDGVRSTLSVPLFYFYDSLTLLAIYGSASQKEQKHFLKKVNANQKKMKKWARHSPMNYLHKFYLVEAQRDRALKQNLKAMDDYDRAIQLAQQNGYIQEEALAQELAAQFYLDWGKKSIAEIYLTKAYYNYARWGAKTKLEELKRSYPQLLQLEIDSPVNQPLENHYFDPIASCSTSVEVLDLATVLKANQALSEEIQLDRLISKLMQMLISYGGAQVGCLVLIEKDKLTIVARCVSTQECDLQNLSVESSQNVPVNIINYVWRTLETLVIDDVSKETRWVWDPYNIRQQPKSILCTPLLYQSKAIGILYLENNLATGAFTKEHREIVGLLGSQAAISLANANLYHNLQQSEARERERAIQLEQSLQELQKTQTELLQTQEKLRHDAFHDALTGLPNRAWFTKILEHALLLSLRNTDYLYAVLFLDLDRFKIVNDSLGHLVGDELLKNVAARLRACLRAADTVARLGGDEFAILLEEMRDIREAIVVAQRIKEQLTDPFQLNGYEVQTGTSIGIALSTMGYQRAEEILRDADAAMYHAKAQGKGRYAVFDPKMQTRMMESLQLENDLRQAIKRQEFGLHYQPIISLATGRLSGFEVLVRWYHPIRGLISPVEFIPIAEETGLINDLGSWILRSACSQKKIWLSQFPQSLPLVINVNLSAVQLKQFDLLEQFSEIFSQTGLPSSCLKLEITESCILETFTSEAKRLKQLKNLGIKLCIDDFGTGYSSLSRLHEFPIDTLKIDRSFVSRLHNGSSHAETVQMIVTLAHSLGMDVVAEGVETTAQLEQLRDLGCEWGQGYLFSRPVNSRTASEFLGSGWSVTKGE